jgi:hypothetical protein
VSVRAVPFVRAVAPSLLCPSPSGASFHGAARPGAGAFPSQRSPSPLRSWVGESTPAGCDTLDLGVAAYDFLVAGVTGAISQSSLAALSHWEQSPQPLISVSAVAVRMS